MCLGIPGRVIGPTEHPDLVVVDVFGVERRINTGLLEGETVGPGDWVLIHVGFVLSKLDEAEARLAAESLHMMGSLPEMGSSDGAGVDESEILDGWTKEEVEQWAS